MRPIWKSGLLMIVRLRPRSGISGVGINQQSSSSGKCVGAKLGSFAPSDCADDLIRLDKNVPNFYIYVVRRPGLESGTW